MTHDRSWLDALEPSAPDVVVLLRLYDAAEYGPMLQELRRRAGDGTAARVAAQLEAVAAALGAAVASLPDEAFGLPGGEADWTVAEALGHTLDARRLLTFSAALAAAGRWPPEAPAAVPSVPGPAGATRAELLDRLERSRRQVAGPARTIAGHETQECPLDHPLVGHLRCGEWLLFAGVHDLMHLDQLHSLAGGEGHGEAAGAAGARGETG
ncbi:MAG: DinB family protein [Candidatus Limnocylindrales bacterium]